MKNNLWTLDLDNYLEIMKEAIELGKERGKKTGDNLEKEFFEIAEKKEMLHQIKHIGTTEYDLDLMVGNLREAGLKILSPIEEKRKQKRG